MGRRRAAVLAGRLARFRATRVVSSVEPKAVETAEIVAQHLGIPSVTAPGLHEHARDTAPFLPRADFDAAVEWLFEEPGRVVFGEESADAAADRFATAVDAIRSGGDDLVVTHGAVISLYVARACGIHPFPLWRGLGLPSYVVLSGGARTSVEVVSAAG